MQHHNHLSIQHEKWIARNAFQWHVMAAMAGGQRKCTPFKTSSKNFIFLPLCGLNIGRSHPHPAPSIRQPRRAIILPFRVGRWRMRGLKVFGMPRSLGQNRWFLDHVLKPKNPKKGSHTACLKAAGKSEGGGRSET